MRPEINKNIGQNIMTTGVGRLETSGAKVINAETARVRKRT